jgi:hypothetical protein
MKNCYTDEIMGDWKYDKKGSTKESMCYRRRADIKLHKDFALSYTDPVDFQDYKVYGDVTLTETKLIEVKTSQPSFFRGVELKPESKKDLVIK